MRKCAFTY